MKAKQRKQSHLFLIIDEFAELKREEPDFCGAGQCGAGRRSLGLHLILATQNRVER